MHDHSKKDPVFLPEFQHCEVETNDDYDMALVKIASLEEELRKKNDALDKFLHDQLVLREYLDQCLKNIQHSYDLFITADASFNDQRQQMNERIDTLAQENQELKLANEAWIKRSIKQEFDAINAREEITKMEVSLALAINKIALLEKKLKPIKTNDNGK
jgi:chromosome segregation ATPase